MANGEPRAWQLSNTVMTILVGLIGILLTAGIIWIRSAIVEGDRMSQEHFTQIVNDHKERDNIIQANLLSAILAIQKKDEDIIILVRELQKEQAVIKRNQEIRLERERARGIQ